MRRRAPGRCRRRSQLQPGWPLALAARAMPCTGLPAGSADGAVMAYRAGRNLAGSAAGFCGETAAPAAARWPRRRCWIHRSDSGHGGRLPSRAASSASIAQSVGAPRALVLSCRSSTAYLENQPGALPDAPSRSGWRLAAGFSLFAATAPWSVG